jgi:hypothetical protein
MKVIESLEEFNQFKEIINTGNPIIVPIMTDKSAHPRLNSLCALFVRIHKWYVLPFRHNDAINLPIELLTEFPPATVYTPSKKILMHLMDGYGGSIMDMKGMEYVMSGEVVDEVKFHPPQLRQLQQKYSKWADANRFVPLVQLFKFAKTYTDYLEQFMNGDILLQSANYDFLNDVVIPSCHFMEASGVHVDPVKFSKSYGEKALNHVHDGLVFTEYNPYTSTGRVTNKHGGVNFAAVEKKHGTREAFTSRHKNGAIVLIDFESFHLRLISELIGYNLPSEPVHAYLAKQYFGVDELTPEQYEDGKKLTFKFLYSDTQEGTGIAFFDKVYYFIDRTWKDAVNAGYYQLNSNFKINLNHVDHPSPAKLFNYILQWRETEVAMTVINQLKPEYYGKQSNVTLYTYDSIMIDYCYEDGGELLASTVRILSMGGNYPVRVYAGPNYQDLRNISSIVK